MSGQQHWPLRPIQSCQYMDKALEGLSYIEKVLQTHVDRFELLVQNIINGNLDSDEDDKLYLDCEPPDEREKEWPNTVPVLIRNQEDMNAICTAIASMIPFLKSYRKDLADKDGMEDDNIELIDRLSYVEDQLSSFHGAEDLLGIVKDSILELKCACGIVSESE